MQAAPPTNERDPFSSASLADLRLGNRLFRTAAFEGMCPGGAPSEALVRHHAQMAAGGIGLTTVAYCSVSPEGRTYGHQLLMTPEHLPAFRRLTEAVHAEGAAVSVQLGHCGYFASRKVIGGRPWGASRVFNLYGLGYPRVMTESDIAQVIEQFAKAATRAREAGFDAVELHFGHGYLVSQFLSPFTNRREDGWGGSPENRLRLPLAVLRAVRERLPPGFPVILKVNLTDGFARGLPLEEAIEGFKQYEAAGASALVLSGGFVSKTPFFMLRGSVPTREMVKVQQGALRKVGLTLFGRIFVQCYPFEELFFLEAAKRVRAEVRLPLVLVGGICSRTGMRRGLAEGFDFLALGRALIRDSRFPLRIQRGEIEASDCDHCNRCIAEMDRGGVRCVCPPEGEATERESPGSPASSP